MILDHPVREAVPKATTVSSALPDLAVDLDLLCCPHRDHGRLRQISETAIRCASCQQEFKVVGRRLVLLDETRSLFSSDDVAAHGDERQFPESTGWKFFLRRLFPASASRDVALDLVPRHLQGLTDAPSVLVIGCGSTGGRYSKLLPSARLFLTDVTLQGDAVIACDGECLPFPDESLECVIVDQVLEHALHPARIVDEIHRCLKRTGLVFSGVPFHMPVHGFPFDFQRYTPVGHRMLFARFDELEFCITQGPVSALSLTLVGFCASLWDNLWWRRASSLLVRLMCGPMLRFDRRYVKAKGMNIPGASAFLGRKRNSDVSLTEVVTTWAEPNAS